MRIVFMGPPGVGKGTQSQRLIRYLGVPHLSTGEMLRQACRDKTDLGLLSQEFMSQGQLVPDPVMLELVGRRLEEEDCRQGYLLDGFPRTLGQAKSLDDFLAARNTPLTLVMDLKVDTEELVKRLSARGREDDRPEIIRKRLDEYARRTAPLSEYYRRQGVLQDIDGLGTPDEVFGRIQNVVEQHRPKRN